MTSASTIGARAPKSVSARPTTRSRSPPRPCRVESSSRARRTTSTPRPSDPAHRPATTQVVPPGAGGPSGHRSCSAPRHSPPITSASTTPPPTGAGFSSCTIAARLPAPGASRSHLPTQAAARSRSAAPPHRRPATSITPVAAPSGARRSTSRAPASTGNPTPHTPTPHAAKKERPTHRPAPNATAIHRIGGRTGGRLSVLHELHRHRPAARRQAHLAEALEQHHVEPRPLLVGPEAQLGEHLALPARDVMRCQPVERVHHDVAPARVAAAEAGQLGPELVVLAVHDVP